MNELWTQWTQTPEVMATIGVLATVILQLVWYGIKKKVLNFDGMYPTVTAILEAIISAGARSTNPAQAKALANKQVKETTSQEELARLSKKMATSDPVQEIYDKVTFDARLNGASDGSRWWKELGTGLAQSGVTALANSLAKKWF